MGRLLPWVLVVVAIGVTAFLALPLILDDHGDESIDGLTSLDAVEHDRGAAHLIGASGARVTGAARSRGRYRIYGEVVDGDGKPLADLRVVAWLDAWTPDRRERLGRSEQGIVAPAVGDPPIIAETRSGADGSFEFFVRQGDRHHVRAVSDAPLRSTRGFAYFRANQTEQHVRLTVLEGTTLRGRVLDASERGVEAYVEASLSLERGWSHFYTNATPTDPSTGSFELAALPAGTWRVTVTLPGRARLHGLEVDVPYDGVWTIRVGQGAGSVVGRVTGAGETPVAGATVLVSTRADTEGTWVTARGVSGADGTYAIDAVPKGEVTSAKVLHPDYVPFEASPPLARWSGAEVKAGKETRLDLTLEEGAAVLGRVSDLASGEPMAGVEVFVVSVMGKNSGTPSATTGTDGGYRIGGIPPGRHLLVARHVTHYLPAFSEHRWGSSRPTRWGGGMPVNLPSQSATLPRGLALAVQPTDREIERDLVMRRGLEIRGRVVGPEGESVADAVVVPSNSAMARLTSSLGMEQPPPADQSVRSARDGTFRLQGLAPRNDWVIAAQKAPLVGKPVSGVSVRHGEKEPEIEIEMELGATLVGRVIGPEGAGRTAMVYAYPTGRPGLGWASPPVTTSADGSFRLEGVPPGDVSLNAWLRGGGGSTHLKVEGLEPGEVRDDLELKVASGVEFSGVLVDPEGKPLARRTLRVSGMRSPSSSHATTDKDGSFVVQNAPEGKVRVNVHGPQGESGALQQPEQGFESPARDVRLVFEPAKKTIVEGRVVGPDGSPVPLCRVEIRADRRPGPRYGYAAGQSRMEEVVGGEFRRVVTGEPPFRVTVTEACDREGLPLNLKRATARVEDADAAPVVIQLERGLEAVGRVVTSTGEGVQHVGVYNQVNRTITDVNGAFRLGGFEGPEDRLQFDISAAYVPHAPVPIGKAECEIVVRLESAATVAGVVLGTGGEPVAQVIISTSWVTEKGVRGSASATSGSNGRFVVRGMPPGVRLRVNARARSGGSKRAPVSLDDVLAGTTDLVLRLKAGVSIEGIVVSAAGEPVENGHVRGSRPNGGAGSYARLGKNGVFKLENLEPGTWTLVASSQMGGPGSESVIVDAPATGIRLVLPDTQTIKGRIVGEVPLDGYSVYARGLDNQASYPRGGRTDAKGNFTIQNTGGQSYSIRVQKRDSDHYGYVDSVAPGTTNLEIRLERGLSIEGTFRDSQGIAVAQGYLWVSSDTWSATATVSDGTYHFRGLPPGRYKLLGMADMKTRARVELGEADAGTKGLNLRAP